VYYNHLKFYHHIKPGELSQKVDCSDFSLALPSNLIQRVSGVT